jgi:cell division protein FtsQ
LDKPKPNFKLAAKKIALLLFWLSMLGGTLLALAFGHKMEEDLSCKEVFVGIYPNDIHFYNRQRILETVKKGIDNEEKLIGMSFSEINTSKLEKSLNKQNWTENAHVYSDMKGNLNIKVYQRVPMFRVLRFDGTQFYVDKYGVKFPVSEHFTARVLMSTGDIFERLEKGDSLYSFVGNELFKVASFVDNDAFLKAFIEQIFVRADNELVLVPKIGKQIIIFGNSENLEEKFNKLKVFYKEGLNLIGWSKYSSIDVRFKSQVICKK